jgi:ABC-type uncharacterized transport system permease subunit
MVRAVEHGDDGAPGGRVEVSRVGAFSIAAWMIYALLLWGRHQLGWRGYTAIRWTLAGFALLMLAYFGSKLVLELILSQP